MSIPEIQPRISLPRLGAFVLFVISLVILTAGCPNLQTNNGGTTPDGGSPTDGQGDGADGQTDGGGDDGGASDGDSTDGDGQTDGSDSDSSGSDGDTSDGGGADSGGDSNDDTGNDGDTSGDGDTGDGDSGGGDSSDDGSDTGDSGDGDDTGDGTSDPGPAPTQIAHQRIAQTGDSVHGQPDTAKFTQFGIPIIDAAGRVAFWARYSGGNGNAGLYVWDGGVPRRVVDDDTSRTGEVPERDASAYFGKYTPTQDFDPLEQPIAWGKDGRLLFVTRLDGTGQSRGLYRWRASDGNMVRVADMEQMAALFTDASGSAFNCEFYQPGVADAGIVVFVVRYTYITTGKAFVLGERGVFSSNGVSISVIADNRLSAVGDVPDQDNSKWDTFESLTTLIGGGDMVFQGTYLGGNGNRGVYLQHAGNVYRVIHNAVGVSYPGLQTGTIVGDDEDAYDAIAIGPGIGAQPRVAVDTKITVNGTTRDAVLIWDNQQWNELTGPNNAVATALLSGVNTDGYTLIYSGTRPYLVKVGQRTDITATLPAVLTGVSLQWETAGAALNDNDRALLSYTRLSDGTTSDTPGLAFWTGAQLLIAADPVAAVPAADFERLDVVAEPELDRPGRSGALNDSDALVFRTVDYGTDGAEGTDDDAQALYLATAE
ncbi:MAG: hypothetical protein KKB50_14430 [Planctomycetes bacterium]|nr:hypothetical protein [Planctomycetota bacterium]